MKTKTSTYSELFLHFVWATKKRYPMIDPEIETALKKIFLKKAGELGIQIIEEDGTADHRHLIVRSIPSLAPSDIAKHLKGASSHFVNSVVLKHDHPRSLYWQDGYAVYTVSPSAVQSIRRYIRNQKEHHANNDLDPDMEVD